MWKLVNNVIIREYTGGTVLCIEYSNNLQSNQFEPTKIYILLLYNFISFKNMNFSIIS